MNGLSLGKTARQCTALGLIVAGTGIAIGENRLEEAMGFYHDDSPQANEARREITFGHSAYLQRTSTLSFDVIYRDAEGAIILATHRHLRIAGVKFMEELTQTRHVLRRQGDTWKIWSRVDRSPGSPSASPT